MWCLPNRAPMTFANKPFVIRSYCKLTWMYTGTSILCTWGTLLCLVKRTNCTYINYNSFHRALKNVWRIVPYIRKSRYYFNTSTLPRITCSNLEILSLWCNLFNVCASLWLIKITTNTACPLQYFCIMDRYFKFAWCSFMS